MKVKKLFSALLVCSLLLTNISVVSHASDTSDSTNPIDSGEEISLLPSPSPSPSPSPNVETDSQYPDSTSEISDEDGKANENISIGNPDSIPEQKPVDSQMPEPEQSPSEPIKDTSIPKDDEIPEYYEEPLPIGVYTTKDNGDPAGFVSQVNSVFMVPQLGGTMPTTAVNYSPDTIVTATWSPSDPVEVDKTYNFNMRLVLGNGTGYPMYVYAREGTVDIALQFPSGRTMSLVSQTFAENPGIAWQIDYNYVSHPGLWVWGTINYENYFFTPYHSINYNADGGRIIGSSYPTYAEDGGNVPMSSLPQAEKEGYVFGGWKYDESKYGLPPLGNVEQALSAVYDAIYLKAIWTEAPKSYSLSFDPNGGNGEMAEETITSGVATRLPECSFTKDKYTFIGWNTKADGSGKSYEDGETVSFTEDTILYAQWKLVPNYVVIIPDGDNISIDPVTRVGTARIGVDTGSVIPEDSHLMLSVNSGTYYDGGYRLRTVAGNYIGYTFSAHKILIRPIASGSLMVCSIARLVERDKCPLSE